MIRKLTFFLITISCLLVFAIYAPLSNAAIGSDWQAGRIIDDSIFTNKDSMSVSEIQNFLNNKVGTGVNGRVAGQCDTNGVATSELGGGTRAQYGAAHGNPAPFTCLKDYYEVPKTSPDPGLPANNYGGQPIPAGAESAAQLIWNAAQQYDISPKVLLVTIQKESVGPLITDDWPFQSQYTYAMGAHCPDSGSGCDPNYAGFSIQVSESAALFRYYLDNMTQSWWPYKKFGNNSILYNPATSCGSSTVSITTMATAALYTYTPYQPNQAALSNLYGTGDSCSSYGNRNFWRIYSDWFGSPNDGSPVYKSVDGTQLYVVWGNTKYYIPSYDMMDAWGLQYYNVNIVSDDYINGLQNGPTLTNIAKMSDNPNSSLFLLDDKKRYPIPLSACKYDLQGQPITTTSWGIDCFNSGVVGSFPELMMEQFTVQDITLPQMIANNNSVWKLEGGKKRLIVDSLVIDVLGGWTQVRWMQDMNAQQPIGSMLMENGWAVRFSSSPQVYLYDDNQLNPIATPDDLVAWGLQNSIHDFPASDNSITPLPSTTTPITPVAEDLSNSYYLVDKGYKLPLDDATAQWPTANATLAPGALSNLTSIPLSNVYLSDSSGQIFTVYGDKYYVFPTMDDFFALGFNTNTIRRVSGAVQNLPGLTYGGMHMASGRLYKVTNNVNQIYMVSGSTSIYVNSINYPGLPYSKLITVDPITAARYPIAGTYQP